MSPHSEGAMRRINLSPAPSSYDSRRNSSASSGTAAEDEYSSLPDNSYYHEHGSEFRSNVDPDESMDDAAEVEEALRTVDDEMTTARSEDSRSQSEDWGSTSYASYGTPSSASGSAPPYSTSGLGLSDRDRRVLSTITERTEGSSRASVTESGYGSLLDSTLR